MDPMVLAAGTAVVNAMAVDTWQQTRAAIVEWWRGVRPGQAGSVDTALERSRARVLAARRQQDAAAEHSLTAEWQLLLQELAEGDPELAGDLHRLVADAPAPEPGTGPAEPVAVVVTARAYGSSRVYQAGRDLHVTEQ